MPVLLLNATAGLAFVAIWVWVCKILITPRRAATSAHRRVE